MQKSLRVGPGQGTWNNALQTRVRCIAENLPCNISPPLHTVPRISVDKIHLGHDVDPGDTKIHHGRHGRHHSTIDVAPSKEGYRLRRNTYLKYLYLSSINCESKRYTPQRRMPRRERWDMRVGRSGWWVYNSIWPARKGEFMRATSGQNNYAPGQSMMI